MTTITNFIMLVGPWELAKQRLNKEEPELQLETKYNFSLSPFKNNEQHLFANLKDFKIDYIDELDEDVKNAVTNDFGGTDISAYKNYIKKNNIQPTDLQFSIPPCAGLSLLNCGNRGCDAKANGWMYETVKWFIAQENTVLCLENAPGLVGADGLKVLKNVENILKANGVENDYRFHLTKTTTKNHGIPQHRSRSFFYLYKKKEHLKLKNIAHEKISVEKWLEKYPQTFDESIDHIPLKDNWATVYIDFLNDKNEWHVFRDLLNNSPESEKIIACWPTWIENYKKDPKYFDGYENMKKDADYKIKKLEQGLGYWDASPNFIKGRINAIVAKNSYNTIHPIYNRYLTIRELMSLMGYPDDYKLVNVQKNFNHICQSLPICTGMDHIRWAAGIATENPKYVEKMSIQPTARLFLQSNMKADLENETLETDFKMPWNKFVGKKTSKLKAFVK